MPKTFAFLRAINVGGRTVAMADLKARFQELGLRGVETFIASGNVVFEKALGLKATSRGLPTLQRLVAKHLS